MDRQKDLLNLHLNSPLSKYFEEPDKEMGTDKQRGRREMLELLILYEEKSRKKSLVGKVHIKHYNENLSSINNS